MDISILNIMELECGNFDNALCLIKDKAETGEKDYIKLLAQIYLHGIGVQQDTSEYLRLQKLTGGNTNDIH